MNSSLDKILYSKPYRTADELESVYLRKVVLIQCMVRRFLAILSVNKLRIDIQINQRKIEEVFILITRPHSFRTSNGLQEMKKLSDKRRLSVEYADFNTYRDYKLHPKTRKDFEVLYHGLDDWKIKQLDKLKDKILIPEQRKVFLVDLINTEASLIQVGLF